MLAVQLRMQTSAERCRRKKVSMERSLSRCNIISLRNMLTCLSHLATFLTRGSFFLLLKFVGHVARTCKQLLKFIFCYFLSFSIDLKLNVEDAIN